MIRAVNQDDIGRCVFESFRCGETAKTSAHNHNPRNTIIHHIQNLFEAWSGLNLALE